MLHPMLTVRNDNKQRPSWEDKKKKSLHDTPTTTTTMTTTSDLTRHTHTHTQQQRQQVNLPPDLGLVPAALVQTVGRAVARVTAQHGVALPLGFRRLKDVPELVRRPAQRKWSLVDNLNFYCQVLMGGSRFHYTVKPTESDLSAGAFRDHKFTRID